MNEDAFQLVKKVSFGKYIENRMTESEKKKKYGCLTTLFAFTKNSSKGDDLGLDKILSGRLYFVYSNTKRVKRI